jgi:predicted naringenin-chalcone synthase
LDSTTATFFASKGDSIILQDTEVTDWVPQPAGSAMSSSQNAAPQILGLSTALPAGSIAQADSATLVQSLGITQKFHRLLPGLYRKSGVERRASVLLNPVGSDLNDRQSFYRLATAEAPKGPTTAERMKVYEEHAGPLLLRAAATALDRSQISENELTHLITVSCTGFYSPGVDHYLMDQLNLPQRVQRAHIGFMGCHGLLNGLRVAESIARANPQARVLLGAVELCSLHQQYCEDSEQLVANALFADGAAAMVLGMNEDSTRGNPHWQVVSSFSQRIPNTADFMSWKIGDHGFQMTLSPMVPQVIEEQLREPITEWLQSQEVDRELIRHWAIHPGGPRILDSVGRCFDLSDEAIRPSREILAQYGNMSSPTVMFILDSLTSQVADGELCVMIGFGPGLHAEAILLRRSSGIIRNR